MMQNFWAIKIYSRNYMAGTRGKKKSLLKIMKLPQKILANENFKLQNSFDRPVTWYLEYPPRVPA